MANQHKCGINSTHWSQVLISGQNLVIKKEVIDLEDSKPTSFTSSSSSSSNETNRPKLRIVPSIKSQRDADDIEDNKEQISRSVTTPSGVVVVTDDVPYLTRKVAKKLAAASICNGVRSETPHLESYGTIVEEELDFSNFIRSVGTPPPQSVKGEGQQLIESSSSAADEFNDCSREEIERSLSSMKDENKSLLEQVDQLKSHLGSRDRELDRLLQLVKRRSKTQCVDTDQPTIRENRMRLGGHIFAPDCKKPLNGNVHWHCVYFNTKRCKSRFTIQPDGQLVIKHSVHNHPPAMLNERSSHLP